MKPIERGEILGLADYEAIREPFRSRVIAEKKHRRVQLGDYVSVLFENRDTVLLQIQEMLRTERITRPGAIQHEIDTYNESVPADGELSCTLMIEIEDAAVRDAFLRSAKGFERHVWIVTASDRIAAQARDRGDAPDRTTAVHYLKFALPARVAGALRNAGAGHGSLPVIALEADHPAYKATATLPSETLRSLGEDLVPESA